jgi:hypothetical protein
LPWSNDIAHGLWVRRPISSPETPLSATFEGSASLIAYLETSAFVKLLIAEQGSLTVRDAWKAADTVVAARLLYQVKGTDRLARVPGCG